MSSKVKVICVLKSGGVYTPTYAYVLRKAVLDRHPEWDFVCITDMFEEYWTEPLRYDFPGKKWWSKIEIFRHNSRITTHIYLDLDTVINGSLQPLADAATEHPGAFYMRRPTKRKQKWASGVMAWKGDYDFLLREFVEYSEYYVNHFKWDQRYISNKLEGNNATIRAIQDVLPGMVSYKHDCRGVHDNAIPDEFNLICFHGKPRPHDVGAPYFNTEEVIDELRYCTRSA